MVTHGKIMRHGRNEDTTESETNKRKDTLLHNILESSHRYTAYY